MRWQVNTVVALILAGAVTQPCAAADRIALVIGNSSYEGSLALRNPANDADALEAALGELGFAVVKKKDLALAQMEEALVEFRRKLPKGGLGLFYYAGHGIQVKGENYLVPIGARLREEFEVKRQCLEVGQVLEAMGESEANLKILVLDCCRDNPLKRGWSRSSAGQGLASISTVPEGTVIAFSTAPNLAAADGTGKNSPYAEQLAVALRNRPAGGLELSEVFREASRAVKKQTGQVPWLNMEASLEKYYLWRAATVGTAQPPGGSAPPALKMPGREERAGAITNSIGMKLVLIPAGESMMGNGHKAEDDIALFKRYGIEFPLEMVKKEYPRHRARITKPFYLGVHEVTRGDFRKFVDATGYKTDAERDGKGGYATNEEGRWSQKPEYTWRNAGFAQTDDHPVVHVSWNDAAAFCQWLSRKEGSAYRLPTEAEWEYACRAGTAARYYCGDDPEGLAEVGNTSDATAKAKFPDWKDAISGNDGHLFTAPAGSFRPNALGLHDLHGNVLEWCADWYSDTFYATSPTDDPSGPEVGTSRVLRGGSWASGPYYARASYRSGAYPDYRNSRVGFRVARTN